MDKQEIEKQRSVVDAAIAAMADAVKGSMSYCMIAPELGTVDNITK